MPHATRKCHICGRLCPRNRALRYHMAKNHPGATAHDQPEAWLDEPLCSIELDDTVTDRAATTINDAAATVHRNDGSSSTTGAVTNRSSKRQNTDENGPPPKRIHRDTTACRDRRAAHPPTASVATQTTTAVPPPASHQDQILRGERLRTVRHADHPLADAELREFGEHLLPYRRRPLCDCFRCVRHAILIAETALAFRTPARVPPRGIQFVHLPGLALDSSSSRLRQELDGHLSRSPEKATFACGCTACTVHRCTVRTFQLALDLPSSTPEVERNDTPSGK